MSNYPDGCNLDHPAIAGHPEPEEAGYAVYCDTSDEWWGHPLHDGAHVASVIEAEIKAKLMAGWAAGQYEEQQVLSKIYLILDHGEDVIDRYELELLHGLQIDTEVMDYNIVDKATIEEEGE